MDRDAQDQAPLLMQHICPALPAEAVALTELDIVSQERSRIAFTPRRLGHHGRGAAHLDTKP